MKPRTRKSDHDTIQAMDVYERETRKILRRFLDYRLSFAECIGALDSALADLIPRLTGEQIVHLRTAMLQNNEIVMKEMERRGPAPVA
jgi:hypothetical protein